MLFKGRGLPRASISRKRGWIAPYAAFGILHKMANDFFDAVVQLDLEHEPSKLGVAGSSPVSARVRVGTKNATHANKEKF